MLESLKWKTGNFYTTGLLNVQFKGDSLIGKCWILTWGKQEWWMFRKENMRSIKKKKISSLYPRETETVWSSCITSCCVQLHGTTQKGISSTLLLTNLNPKPPKTQTPFQKCERVQPGPGPIGDVSSLDCNSGALPPTLSTDPKPRLQPHMRGRKSINLLVENTNSYLACAITWPLSSYSRYAEPMIHVHLAPRFTL